MHISPVNNYFEPSYKGSVSTDVAKLTKTMSDGWIRTANSGKYKTSPMINTCLYASEKINNVFINLSTMMERFCRGCELTFKKSDKSGKYRFFVQHNYSNYKTICSDIEFSPELNKLTDIDKLENLERMVAKLNPYQENSNFIIQRKADSKFSVHDGEFEPDADYIFVEDKLIRNCDREATMEDIEEFLSAAKEEGLLNG